MLNDFEKLKACFADIGIPFFTTDDSSESEIDEQLDTVVVVAGHKPSGPADILFFFTREGKYKNEIAVF
jgi:hypothetical protein